MQKGESAAEQTDGQADATKGISLQLHDATWLIIDACCEKLTLLGVKKGWIYHVDNFPS